MQWAEDRCKGGEFIHRHLSLSIYVLLLLQGRIWKTTMEAAVTSFPPRAWHAVAPQGRLVSACRVLAFLDHSEPEAFLVAWLKNLSTGNLRFSFLPLRVPVTCTCGNTCLTYEYIAGVEHRSTGTRLLTSALYLPALPSSTLLYPCLPRRPNSCVSGGGVCT